MVTATDVKDPLVGFTVGVTADRRRDELVSLLQRRGARVLEAPTMRIVPLEDDAALRAATRQCLDGPLDYVVATTGVGWRGWMNAAEVWGMGDSLHTLLESTVVLTRGPKATGAVRASGLREVFSPPSEASEAVLAWLLERDVAGRRIAIQEHGAPMESFVAELTKCGAEVIQVPVYAWGPPVDPAAVRRLLDAVLRREIHAVTFTSAPAAAALLLAAAEAGYEAELLEALRTDVLPVCIGPVCARPLSEAGIVCVWPERGRLGSMVRTLTEELPARARRELTIGDRRVVVQGSAVLIGGKVCLLPPVPAAVLRVLAERPGWVLSRAELLRRVWNDSGGDEHTVEAAVARLRAALGPDADLVRTVTKRGYRLAVEV